MLNRDGEGGGVTQRAFDAAWLEASTRDVQRRAESVLARQATDDTELVLSNAVLSAALKPGFLPAVHLPLLVCAGISGDADQARDLAAGLVLLDAGLEALDTDDALRGPLAHLPRSLVALTATSFVSHLAQSVLLGLDVEPAVKLSLLEQLGAGLGRVARGQLLEAKLASSPVPSAEDTEAVVCHKSGERCALYAALAARLANATSSELDDYQGYARAFGVARQLHTSLLDLFGDAPSRDLRAGLRTLPVVLALREPGEARDELLGVLAGARSNDAVSAEVSQRVRQTGALRGTLARKEVYCQRALRLLASAAPQPAAAEALASAVRGVSLAEAPADFGSLPPPPAN